MVVLVGSVLIRLTRVVLHGLWAVTRGRAYKPVWSVSVESGLRAKGALPRPPTTGVERGLTA